MKVKLGLGLKVRICLFLKHLMSESPAIQDREHCSLLFFTCCLSRVKRSWRGQIEKRRWEAVADEWQSWRRRSWRSASTPPSPRFDRLQLSFPLSHSSKQFKHPDSDLQTILRLVFGQNMKVYETLVWFCVHCTRIRTITLTTSMEKK